MDVHQELWHTLNRFLKNLDTPKSLGEEAARRTVNRLGGRKVKSRAVPIVLHPEVSSGLVSTVFYSIKTLERDKQGILRCSQDIRLQRQ